MKSICLFSSYFTQPGIPYYVKVYLENIIPYFSETVFITNDKELDEESHYFLNLNNISLLKVENEGWDFGMWYKAIVQLDTTQYQQIALINDSCVLFKPLDEFMNWSRADASDLQGITRSDAIAPHIQSYFMIIHKKAIQPTVDYFNKHKVLPDVSSVITTYEVGLSSYLVSMGLKIGSFIDNNHYQGEFSPYYQCIDYHISRGIPVIKKKILFESYRQDELFTLARMNFNISVQYYIDLIKKSTAKPVIDFKKLESDKAEGMSLSAKIKYILMVRLINAARLFRKKK
jgi:lipopolysaccharide biosynthesis protein